MGTLHGRRATERKCRCRVSQITQPLLGIGAWYKVYGEPKAKHISSVAGPKQQKKRQTDFVQHEDEFFPFVLATSDLLLDETTAASLRITSVEHKYDDVTLINDLMQGTDVVSPCLLFRLGNWAIGLGRGSV